MNRQRFFLPSLIALTVLRWVMLPLRELSPLEAYESLCSERLGLWHAMMGPVLPTLMRISTALFGANEFGVRFFAPLLILAASWLLWRLARGLFDVQTASWAVVFFNVLPVVNLASITLTPTTLGIAGSVALLYVLRLALHRKVKWDLSWWAVGVMMMALIFTDWPLIMASLAAGGTLMLTARGRRAVLKWPVIPILVGALGIALTTLTAWASEHHWICFSLSHHWMDTTIFETLWHTLLGHSLVALAVHGWGLTRSLLRRPFAYPTAFLCSFAVPLLTLDVLSLGSLPWPNCGYAGWVGPVSILLAQQFVQWTPKQLWRKAWARRIGLAVLLIHACVLMQTDAVREVGVTWKLSPKPLVHSGWLPADPSRNLMGWRCVSDELAALIKAPQTKLNGKPFLVASKWQLAAPLAFYLREAELLQPALDRPRVGTEPSLTSTTPFVLWSDIDGDDTASAPVLYITDEVGNLPASVLKQWSEQRLVAWFDVTHGGQHVRTVKVFACSGAMTGKK